MSEPSKPPLVLTPAYSKAATEALRRGDRKGLIEALKEPEKLAQLAIDLRRESVATIGSHEAFVRHTSDGDLLQVIRPVRLSMSDRTLYQMTKGKPFIRGTDDPAPRGTDKSKVEWRQVPLNPGTAELTYQGYIRVNAVAGCHVVQPPSVVVDGEKRTNPYVERVKTATGRLGDIQRIVVGIAVIGPTPATGNLVAVTYTLDYDPAKDLQHMLAQLAENAPEDCYLVDEEAGFEKQTGWKLTPLYGGVGFYYNLRNAAVVTIMADFVNLLQNAMKKASTVARRNAMRNHPALGITSVNVDDNGVCVLPVVGWAVSQTDAKDLMDKLVQGQDVGDQIKVISEVQEGYDPQKHDAASEAPAKVILDVVASPDVEEKNRLISQIDDQLALLSPAQVAGLGYRPEATSTAELRETLGRMNAMIADEGGAS